MSELNQIQPAQAQIESVLHHVEQQQEQLAATLDECEREAALLLGEGEASAAATSTGPDAERERAYATADAVSRQLADVNKSLNALVTETNQLGRGAGMLQDQTGDGEADDPVAQISAILAAHLGSLQFVGQSSERLQAQIGELEGRVKGVSGGAWHGVRRSATPASSGSPARRSPFAR